ncbi:hypothetical protein SK803_46180 [Lentzea sp. BCCO 10_0856]|uniref:Uncharacterized protein n=1 Tax=Lentzea miocenica TaxID=3095431 RepID=A0ABU4THX9_9PSEU|nr:hypothetical protein [Lentzea sp. BCCO 10_0856]MDX8037629.1 hypothetical protein [Lentzea sp. BCCO 10_0856]
MLGKGVVDVPNVLGQAWCDAGFAKVVGNDVEVTFTFSDVMLTSLVNSLAIA